MARKKKAPLGFEFEDLGIVHSKCIAGSTWTIAEEAADILREVEAQRDSETWSGGYGPPEQAFSTGVETEEERQALRQYDKDIGQWWRTFIMQHLSLAVRLKFKESLQQGRLRDAMAILARESFNLGKKRSAQLSGSRGGPKTKNVELALLYAEEKKMLRKDAYAFLRAGGTFDLPPIYENTFFAPVAHNLANKLLKNWPFRERKPRTPGKP